MNLDHALVRFARILRRAGMPVGTDRVLAACRALALTGVGRRDDVFWTLAAVFVARHEHFEVFSQAFDAYWRPPSAGQGIAAPMAALPPMAGAMDDSLSRRVSEALAEELEAEATLVPQPSQERERIYAADDAEALRTMDFAAMSVAEMDAVRELMARLRLPLPEVPVRRYRAAAHGPRIDVRATLRQSVRGVPGLLELRRSRQRRRHPPLAVLCDISGSMQRYTRMFLQFLHAVTNDRDRVQVFLFGTRLTNVSRQLRNRDVDVALAHVAAAVEDWSGGTRIGDSLAEFNLRWSRRVLGQNAVVLMISDGLERGSADALGVAMERLRKSCRRLIWLNPLLRYAEFEPKAAGMRAMLPHVDRFVPAHNVASLADLAGLLRRL